MNEGTPAKDYGLGVPSDFVLANPVQGSHVPGNVFAFIHWAPGRRALYLFNKPMSAGQARYLLDAAGIESPDNVRVLGSARVEGEGALPERPDGEGPRAFVFDIEGEGGRRTIHVHTRELTPDEISRRYSARPEQVEIIGWADVKPLPPGASLTPEAVRALRDILGERIERLDEERGEIEGMPDMKARAGYLELQIVQARALLRELAPSNDSSKDEDEGSPSP